MGFIVSLFNTALTLGCAATIKPFSRRIKLSFFISFFIVYYFLDLSILNTSYTSFIVRVVFMVLFHRLVLLRSRQSSLTMSVLTFSVLVCSNILTSLTFLLMKNQYTFSYLLTGFSNIKLIAIKFVYVLFFILYIRFLMARGVKTHGPVLSYPIKLLFIDVGIILAITYLLNWLLRYIEINYRVFSAIPNLDFIFYVIVMIITLLGYLLVYMMNSYWFKNENFSIMKCHAELDPMTGVYNRRCGLQLLNSTLYKAKSKNSNFVLCFFDINNLKLVNDRFGHPEGDRLIMNISETARTALRSQDYLIRYGGDEFIIVFEDCNIDDAKNAWNRIALALEKLNLRTDAKYYTSASAGFSSYEENKGLGINDLINIADTEMYKAKRSFKQYTQIE